ncbi:stalk domain-containing protein [Symbiobacterium thermophilum]|uniref:Conserved domain protein n=1 Tax=Symbiobacterium thermophilum (strain DSM 24528 / JCM 14929 / IAM 14863 / T) TaxID=292459 RepID=Q67RK9_SYMTH|nr:stalk domain-containing protein [Symbiobacterium thermophilum]BAD39684.1 conserved domain protein [Symbiobacterium thermophilum IAM 14863]
MKLWKKTAALSALVMGVSAAPALATSVPADTPVDATPISAPVEILPIVAPEEAGSFLRLVGPVEWVDLEGGFWAVAGMRLIGDQEEIAQFAGQEVVVEGTEFTGISFHMVPAIEVMSIRLAGEVEAMAPVLRDVGADAPLPREILVNGKPVARELGSPVVADGVLLVPLRAIAEAMGAEVAWDGEGQLVRVGLADRTVIFRIGQQEAEVLDAAVAPAGSARISMAQPAQIVGDRTMISADAITTVFGLRQTEAEEGVMSLVPGDVADLTAPEPVTLPDDAFHDLLTGRIRQVEDGRILLEGPPMANGEPMLIWLTVSDDTQITVGEGAGTAADLQVGAEVIVSLSGPILESFPARGGADSIQVLPAPKADILTGVIKEIEGGRILLEGEPMDSGEPFLAWLAVDENTVITIGDAGATAADLQVGARVEVELTGPMLMSYPAQGGAARIRILPAE